MSLHVGELVAYLRMDMHTFEDGIAKAKVMADDLDKKDVDVKVHADTAGADAKLAATSAAARRLADATARANIAQLRLTELQKSGTARASALASAQQAVVKTQRDLADAMKGVDEENKKVAKSSQDAGRGMGAVVAAVLLLGPALVPIAAGAAGLAVGFGAMGAAGVLAVVSIVSEMKKGTALGGQYSMMLSGLKDDLATLEKTAATGVLGPFQQTVADLRSKMPALNGMIGEFATITGKTAGVLTSGLIAAFLALEPLARDAGVYILNLSNRFAAMMTGPGVVTFGDYVRSVFPQVMQAVESIVTAVFHLVGAIAPLGLGSLGILRMLADLINAIPTEHLAALVQVASAVYIAFEAFKLLSGPLGSLSTALQGVGVSAEVAATGVRALTIAAGVVGAIIGVATLIYSAFADSQRKNTQAANDFADAIRKDNDALGVNTRLVAAKSLQDSGAADAAARLGFSLSTITDAATGNADALAKVNAVTKPLIEAYGNTTVWSTASADATRKNGEAAVKLNDALRSLNTEVQNGVQANKDSAAATAASTAATDPAAAAQQALADRIGTTTAALALATTGQQTTATATANAAAKMYIENDAAGILKTSLDQLNGKAISAADAQNAFDSSLVNMGDHVTATGQKVHFTTTNIGDMSAASVALRGQLNAQVTNLQNVVEANGGLSESTGKARAQMETMRQQIIDNATAHGVDKDAVTAYVDKLLAIPASVPPTKLDVDNAAAEAKITAYQNMLAAVPRSVTVTVNTAMAANLAATYMSQVPTGHAAGGLIGRASGGLLSGPGTGTSDSILGIDGAGVPIARVSTGEFVVNAAATAKNRAALEAINNGGTAKGAHGGDTYNIYEAVSAEATAHQVNRLQIARFA